MARPADALGAEFGAAVIAETDAMAPYLHAWFRDDTGAACAVLRPRETTEVQAMVRACARLGLAMVPQGGNTGLVSGALPQDAGAQVCLNLGRMNHIRRIDADDYSAIVDAGCVLEAVKDAVAAQDLFLPLTIGAQGSCQIGGVISTNAGGLNVLRYGMMRDQVLGLEVVLADGSLWDGLTTLRKNNTGPDLKQLFIGAEGTFGIITAAALRLVPHPTASVSALIALPDLAAAMAAYHRARRECSELLSAFEFFTSAAMRCARSGQTDAPDIDPDAGAHVLIELAAPGPLNLGELLSGLLERAITDGLVIDGTIAQNAAQAARLWALRESVNENQVRRGPFLRSDVSVRLSALPAFVDETSAAIEAGLPGYEVISYGHFGDGNVHLNVHPPAGMDDDGVADLFAEAKALLNQAVDAAGGSISAEHGIGRLKRADFLARQHPAAARMLAGLKHLLDPDGRMNPGALHGLPPPAM